ncbi:hypothetical protein J6590_073284 [Homalodisca vitripennis]|nr:hypothetical protein J6590_073284 [Homalodisca vitripennis]
MALSGKEDTRNLEQRKLLKGLFEQKNTGTLCDVQLNIQGSSIWGHACVLASCSSYFAQCFQLNFGIESTWENHWCCKKPLVIDLDTVLNETVRLCVTCVTTIIDFMYLRELVVMQGHCQHFCEIVHILKVIDLLPLCEQYFYKKCQFKETKPYSSVVEENNDSLDKTSDNCDNRKYVPVSPSIPVTNYNTNKSLISSDVQQNNSSEKEIPLVTVDSGKNLIKNTKTPATEVTKQCINPNRGSKCNKTLMSINGENKVEIEIIAIDHNYTNKTEATSKELISSGCDCNCCIGSKGIPSNDVKHRKKRKMVCEICTSSSTSVKLMLRHMESKSHYGTLCPVCNTQTKNVNSLMEHLKDHVNSKPYLCQVCNKRNRHWENHKVHMRTHCENKQFVCEICHKTFRRSNSLMVHFKAHNKNYLCNECDYVTSDLKVFNNHIMQHQVKNTQDTATCLLSDCTSNIQSVQGSDTKNCEIKKKFHCQICGKGFTKKKNLLRHIELKYTNVPEYSCSNCKYVTKRMDLLRQHLKKHHNCTPSEEDEKNWKGQKDKSKEQRQLKEIIDVSKNVMGVLIPVQLVSTSEESILDAFNVNNVNSEILVNTNKTNYATNQNEIDDTSNNFVSNHPQLYEVPISKQTDEIISAKKEFIASPQLYEKVPDLSHTSNLNESKNDSSPSLENHNEVVYPKVRTSFQSIQVDFSTDIQQYDNTEISRSVSCVYPDTDVMQNIRIVVDKESKQSVENLKIGSDFIETFDGSWLNEATGELLTRNNFMKVHLIEKEKANDKDSVNKTIDFNDSFQTLLLDEATNGLPVFDFVDDTDDLLSNPQTPQTNVVEFDDPDNLLSWNCLDNGFCSTWVLNETTGELNLVSFGMQPLKYSDELKLDENTGTLTSIDDDETALFLNEGTGDLSVIYFNPNRRECESPLHLFNEQLNPDTLETRSDHSDDDTEFLNEEFIRASANFMADSGNETFLNELTGEFCIGQFSNYQQENQARGNEHVYLNEETGEISWNVLDKDANRGLFSNAEMLVYDYDDSLHCEDLEQFSTEIDNFSSQLGLERSSDDDWQPIDEKCDTLLNECTGEFVKKD